MKRFITEKSDDEFYTSHSGLALIGLCINRFTRLRQHLDKLPRLKKGAISHADVVRGYLGVFCLGKSDFAAIEGFQQDKFFRESLAFSEVSSKPTLCQRLKALRNKGAGEELCSFVSRFDFGRDSWRAAS
jgi:hypothetical protein